MYLIGLTGGIASGKSVVAKRLAEHGAIHIDADALARQVVEPGSRGLAAIAEEFGPGVIAADGSLDRAALGSLVFGDTERLARLNAIVHPLVRERTSTLITEAEQADPDAIVVYDVPLLIEAAVDRQHPFDLIVVVDAEAEARIDRLVTLRGLSRDEAVHRLNSQATDTERLAIADVVIDSNDTLEQTIAQADALFERARSAVLAG
ncbi:MAG TPA: dephospho-CoA kinase [Homoserinimonas sp.]|nr:dephospho-CoA kinase [Homoserinimonas sp.]